jgi:hypothetical protein
MIRHTIAATLLAALAACATGEPGDADVGAEQPALTDGTAEALGVLALLNDDATTFALLDDDVGLDRRAAQGLIDARPLRTVAEVDAVRYVGDSAMNKLVAYARSRGWVPDGDDLLGTFDGVPFTVDQALAALDMVNTVSPEALHDVVSLDARAVASIVEARPIATMDELASLYYVGSAMLQRIKSFVSPVEIGLVSDLDRTVIPPHEDELPPSPYAGVATLYTALEGRRAGDVYYVTARPEWMVSEIPAWLDAHGVPAGPIATGVSPSPGIARGEKVRDISAIFDANQEQEFVLVGDTNHVDADAYRDIIELYPGRVIAAFVHDVKDIEPERLEGLVLFDDYGQVAHTLADLGLVDHATVQAIEGEL